MTDKTIINDVRDQANKSIHDGLAFVFDTFDANAYAASVKVHAIK